MGTFGSDLLQRITSGEMDAPTLEAVDRVRSAVTPALTELLGFGARIRPLTLEGRLVGFIRGVHFTERRQLFQWFTSPEDRITQLLQLGTTLTEEDIAGLDGYEARYLLRLIDEFTEADISLYPYISAFSTTSSSEILWCGRGASVASAPQSRLELPGGWSFPLLAPSDHARLWVAIAASRERSKHRLDDTFNAAMIVRSMVGKGADKLFASLKKTQIALATDAQEPWTEIIKVEARDINFKDGWGHAHQDDSVEGVVREVMGMAKMDKHERYMEAFYTQQIEAATRKEAEMEQHFSRATEEADIVDSYTVVTPEELQDRRRRAHDDMQAMDTEITVALTAAQEAEDRKELRESGRAQPFH